VPIIILVCSILLYHTELFSGHKLREKQDYPINMSYFRKRIDQLVLGKQYFYVKTIDEQVLSHIDAAEKSIQLITSTAPRKIIELIGKKAKDIKDVRIIVSEKSNSDRKLLDWVETHKWSQHMENKILSSKEVGPLRLLIVDNKFVIECLVSDYDGNMLSVDEFDATCSGIFTDPVLAHQQLAMFNSWWKALLKDRKNEELLSEPVSEQPIKEVE